MDGRTDEGMDVWVDRGMDGQIEGWRDKQTDERKAGGRDGK